MRSAAKRKNPTASMEAAAQLSQSWHGRIPRTIRELEECVEVRTDFADLGGLEELVVNTGLHRITLSFGHDVRLGAVLDQARNAVQLYFIGGDQEIDLSDFDITDRHDRELLGEVESITYSAKKDHINAEESPWEHEFGEEEGGTLPSLVYDTLNHKLELVGGSYTIALDDYDGKHSAGIRN